MGELKRKDEQLTTADLASRRKNKDRIAAGRAPGEDWEDTNRENIGNRRVEDPNREWTRPALVQKEKATDRDKAVRRDMPGPISAARSSTQLFSDSDVNDLRGRWSNVQSEFVDEPRRAVEEADELVATVMQRLADGFASERSNLEKQWDKGDNVSTEDLRLALQRYRSFFDRLLAA